MELWSLPRIVATALVVEPWMGSVLRLACMSSVCQGNGCVFPMNHGETCKSKGQHGALLGLLWWGCPKRWREPSIKKWKVKPDCGMRKESQMTIWNTKESAQAKDEKSRLWEFLWEFLNALFLIIHNYYPENPETTWRWPYLIRQISFFLGPWGRGGQKPQCPRWGGRKGRKA